MGQLLLLLVVAVTVAAVVFGVTVLVTGRDPGLVPAEADGRAVPLPGDRPLREADVGEVRFDTALRGYRMAQVDQAIRRAAYDIGYKTELIGVLEAEVAALRDGRTAEADALRRAREQSSASPAVPAGEADAAATGTGGETVTVLPEPQPPVGDAEPAADTTAAAGDAADDAPGGAGSGEEPAGAGQPAAHSRGSAARPEPA
ncbi:DivIVA domain-containing protein [Micromonospora tarapacensis]|uniref:DivIVA domain-containing protein n=1 Tax=Micromonospora tarapacensis TaxID=2835305 RepID=UPI001E47A79D|nr:DivIVA domain-containing protein [Micromonospora tarapacensis]